MNYTEMMRILFFCLILIGTGCGGSLSDEQRESFKKEMGSREIKKVSDEEIFEKAYELGKHYVKQLKGSKSASIARKHGIRVRFADSTASNLSEKHREILEAYVYAPEGTAVEDNVQQNGDSLIYSSAVTEEGQLKGVWLIDIPRKNIVLAL